MARKERAALSILALALAVSILAFSACRRDTGRCDQCGRRECENLTFTVRLRDGGRVSTCCARCGLHYLNGEHPEVEALSVKDYENRADLAAGDAFFVEDSDVSPCLVADPGAPRDDHGCCTNAVYDRCLPSLVAFGSRERADAFVLAHGGSVRRFAELAGTFR